MRDRHHTKTKAQPRGGPRRRRGGAAAPTLEQMSTAVTLIASMLQTDDGRQDEALVVDALSAFFAALPPTLPHATMAGCMLQTHTVLQRDRAVCLWTIHALQRSCAQLRERAVREHPCRVPYPAQRR